MNKLFKKFIYAGRGLGYVFKREQNFRWEIFIFIIAVIGGWWLNFSILAWSILIILSVLVLTSEIYNTIIERVLDLLEPRLSIHVAFLKDIQAGAVLLIATASIIVGIFLIVEYWH
ncbi:MAG: diacylglycerol kinase family protein [Patescibacteria group bacterium]